MWYDSLSSMISFMIILPLILPLLFFCITQRAFHLYTWMGGLGIIAISEGSKHSLFYESKRPKGAWDCNLCANDGDQSGKPGMPSTHAALSMFFSIVYSMDTVHPLLPMVLFGYALLIMISRYHKNCHDLTQILMGASLGILGAACFTPIIDLSSSCVIFGA